MCDHLADVDETIQTYAQGWTLGRMPAVDRAIARVATWEIVYNDDVDAPVAVDEAMTLSRMLSTDESPRYLGDCWGVSVTSRTHCASSCPLCSWHRESTPHVMSWAWSAVVI